MIKVIPVIAYNPLRLASNGPNTGQPMDTRHVVKPSPKEVYILTIPDHQLISCV